MSFVHQEVWHWQIAVYLFLGGLGGATFALAAIMHLFAECDKKMLSIAVLSSVIFLGVGTVFLLADMLQPFKAYLALTNPSSWIFWGVVFINGFFAMATIYLIPLLESWPKIELWIRRIPDPILSLLERFNRLAALGGATTCGYIGRNHDICFLFFEFFKSFFTLGLRYITVYGFGVVSSFRQTG